MTVDDFIAKNALMAEYMMQNSNFDDVIKDYNVSIKFVVDNLQRGTFEEKNGTTVVLSDFQTIEFDDTIEKVANEDKDNDTLTNKSELGEVKWQDITGFVEKMYQSKYGTNMTMYESKVDEMVINNGGYIDINGNFVYGHVKKEKDTFGNIKVFYRVYDYKSNPILKDTDFDGMDDNDDGRTKDNNFKGLAKIERNQNLKVDYHNDYRHFFIDNNKYNSELAEMSLMISNLANDEERKLNIYQGGVQVGMMNTGGVLIGDMTIEDYLEKIGFISLATMSLSNGKAYLSYKIVNYYGKEKLIFGVFVGGFDDEESYIKFITDTNNMHQNYEEVVNSIITKIDNLKNIDLIKQYLNGKNYCYFITGKGISGAIASEVATKLGDTYNIYCYTFGIPNIKSSPTLLYIKNIINEDDLLTKIHSDIGQDGDVYNKSIYWDLIPEYRHYIESPNRYEGNYKKTNTIRDNLEDIKRSLGWSDETRSIYIRELSEYLYSQIGGRITTLEHEIFSNSRDYSTANNEIEERLVEIEEFTDSLTTANSTKAYWCLVKVLDGYDSKYYYDGEKKLYTETMVSAFTTSEELKEDSSMVQALKDIAKWYVNNVATYQGRLQTILLYQYKGEFKYLSKYNFLNTNGTGGDRYVMTSAEQGDALENQSLVGFNDYLKSVYSQYRENKDVQQAENYLIAVLPNTLMHNILRANERQSKNYREKYPNDTSNVDENAEIKLGNIYDYPNCELLNKFNSYKHPGDDCTRFAFAVLELGTGEEARNLGNLSREAIQFIDDDDTGGTIEKMSIYFDIYVGNDFINEFRNGLKTGDMLVGIDGDGDNDRNHCEFIYKDGSANQHVYDVFGWGQVKYTDKSQANFVEDGNKLKNTYDGDYLYSALYRKKVQ